MLFRLMTLVRNWPVYFLNRYGFIKKGDVTLKLWNGLTLISRPFHIDRSPFNDVWIDRSYDPNAFGIPFDWKKCRTIIDIGANIGDFTVYAAHKAPEATVIAVEPEPGNAGMVGKNIAANHLESRTKLHEVGVGKRGSFTLYVDDTCSGGTSLFKHTEKSHEITVPVIPLQEIFEKEHIKHCDYLKMDCEGGEYDAFYGLPDAYFQRIAFMAIEYHHFSKDPLHTPAKLKEFLEAKGFTVIQPKKSFYFAWRTQEKPS